MSASAQHIQFHVIPYETFELSDELTFDKVGVWARENLVDQANSVADANNWSNIEGLQICFMLVAKLRLGNAGHLLWIDFFDTEIYVDNPMARAELGKRVEECAKSLKSDMHVSYVFYATLIMPIAISHMLTLENARNVCRMPSMHRRLRCELDTWMKPAIEWRMSLDSKYNPKYNTLAISIYEAGKPRPLVYIVQSPTDAAVFLNSL